MNARVHHPLEVVRSARERAGRKVTARVARVAVRLGRRVSPVELRRLEAVRSQHDWLEFRAEKLADGGRLLRRWCGGKPFLAVGRAGS